MHLFRFACFVVADLARAVALATVFGLSYVAGAAVTLSLALRGWLKLRWSHAAGGPVQSQQPSTPPAHANQS